MHKRRTTLLPDLGELEPGELGWSEIVELFLEHCKVKGLAYNTRRWHRENLVSVHRLLLENGHTVQPHLVSEGMIKDIISKQVDAGLSANTINMRLKSIKQLYAYLKTQGLVKHNPAENVDRKKTKKTLIETFNEVQLKQLLAMPDKTTFVGLRDYTIMLLLLDTGVRVSELVNIQLADIHKSNNEIIITHGKGDKARRVYYSPRTAAVVKKYLQARGYLPDNPFLLINNENEPLKKRAVQERLAIYGRRTNIAGVRISPHTFRHTFAKFYIMRGGDPFSLQALLGHSTLEMVRHYVNLWGSDLQRMHRQYSPVNHLLADDTTF